LRWESGWSLKKQRAVAPWGANNAFGTGGDLASAAPNHRGPPVLATLQHFPFLFLPEPFSPNLLHHCRYELGRQPANTKLSSNVTVRTVRCRGGNRKFRALRLDTGNFAWGSENTTHKCRILDVTYNSSNNELVCAHPHSC